MTACDDPLPNGEIHVEAVRLAASKSKTPGDIAPYDEAIAWHEYEVADVTAGETEATKVWVAHWTVLRGREVLQTTLLGERVKLKLRPLDEGDDLRDLAVSDDLPFAGNEPPRYLDVGAAATSEAAAVPGAVRWDYGGNVAHQMKLYWALRNQLRLVVMGNSHGTKDISPRCFFGADNLETPLALNLAPAGSDNEMQCGLVREYVLGLPKVEWLVWVVSPRNFNARREDDRKREEFFASPGHVFDQRHREKLIQEAPPPPVGVRDLQKLDIEWVDWWGWEARGKRLLPDTVEETRAVSKATLQDADSSFNVNAFATFSAMVKEAAGQGIRVLLVTPPFHPLTRDTLACDPDETSQKTAAELLRRLHHLDAETEDVWHRNFNEDSIIKFEHREFYDLDHLNREGSVRFTLALIDWMAECAGGPVAAGL